MATKRYKSQEKGFSLFEILIAMSVFAIVGIVASQLVSVSLQSGKASGQKTVAAALAQETMGAANAIILEKWHNIYQPPDGTGNETTDKGPSVTFYPTANSGSCGSVKWCLVAGEESLNINDLVYKRSLYIENVSRDGAGAIVNTGGTDDPSTQKITVTVSWENSASVTLGSISTSNYITRSRNTAASQTQWVSGGSAPTPGETGTYGTDFSSQTNIDLSAPDNIKLQ